MLGRHKKLIIGIACILLVVIIALVVFFSLSNRKTEIYANSYDNKVKLSLGTYSVDSFRVSARTGNSITKTTSADSIIAEKVKGSPYLVSTYNTEFSNKEFINYVLLYEGYYFVVWEDSSGQLVIDNLADEFSAATTEFLFSFPVTDRTFVEDQNNFIKWEELVWINDFNELADFYSKLADGYCRIDEDARTIKLNCCDANNFRDITTEFPITITCTDMGIELTFDSAAVAYD